MSSAYHFPLCVIQQSPFIHGLPSFMSQNENRLKYKNMVLLSTAHEVERPLAIL